MPISSVTHLLIHTVSIYRQSEQSVGKGRWQNNLVPIAVNIRGRIWTSSASEPVIADERKTYNSPVGYLEPDQDVAPEDYIVKDGVYFRVVAVTPPSIAHHTRVLLERIQLANL